MTLLADAPTTSRPITASEVTDAELDGVWVVDVRADTRPVLCPTTPPSPPAPAPYVGWLVPWEDDIVLLASSPDVMAPRHEGPWR